MRLDRGEDYTIDYEAGLLVLTEGIGPDDVLLVEYEHFRSGLGGKSPFQENLFSLSVAYNAPGPFDPLRMDVAQASDIPRPEEESVSIPVMPGRHSVAAVQGGVRIGAAHVAANVAYSYAESPFDAPERPHLPNSIASIFADELAGDGVLLVGHANGLTWTELGAGGDPTGWRHADASSGLSGPGVGDIAGTPGAWWFATRSGLTRLDRSTGAFDQVTSWSRFHERDGLPGEHIVAVVAWEGDTVVAASRDGLAMGDGASWTAIPFHGGAITALERDPFDPDRLYVGAESGLYVLRLAGAVLIGSETLLGGVAVRDLAPNPVALAADPRVWAATDEGVYAVMLEPTPAA
ncbi:MAG TPA: hypothetical protein VF170_18720, partial [Planctomycetaceae bacterium]